MTTPAASSPSSEPPESSAPPPPSEPPASRGLMGYVASNKMLISIIGVVAVIVIVVVLVFATGMIGGGGGSDSQNLILEESSSVTMVDVAAILAAAEIPAQLDNFSTLDLPSYSDDDPEEWKDNWRDRWEDDTEEIGLLLDDVTNVILVGSEPNYAVVTGTFGLNDVRDSLEDADFEKDTYRGLELWEDSGDATALLELEGKGVVVIGDTDDVQEVLKAIDRGKGFVDDSYALKQVLDRAGEGLVINGTTSCYSRYFGVTLRGCDASAEVIKGGDPDTTMLSAVYVFSSNRRSESGLDDIEDAVEDQDNYDVDLEKIEGSGLYVTYEVTIYEE